MMKERSSDLGQLLIIGFDGTEMSAGLSSLLTRVQPAGVILFARNIVSAQQTFQLLKDCQSRVAAPLFTCVDLEGGRVDRLRNAIAPAPSPADVYATGVPRLYRKHGQIIGQSCRTVGFNTDLAPTVDLALEASRTVMSSRAVSADPKQVVIYAREFLAGLAAAKVIGAAKHFPGLGEANLDTHHDLPSVSKPFRALWEQDIYPYRTMRRELRMVLIGHANYAAVTHDDRPASLSKKWIAEVLRKRIGYRGLVLSDDLEMGGVLKAEPIERATVEHVRAGGDLCLICHKEEFVNASYEELQREAAKDRRFAMRAAESLTRIGTFKKKAAELRGRTPAPSKEKIDKLSRALWEFGEQVRMAGIVKDTEARG
jgi:beta-N-acetylhexosaminidase